jgi:hypothetical protein
MYYVDTKALLGKQPEVAVFVEEIVRSHAAV